MIFVLLNGVCYAEINEINRITSEKHINDKASDNKTKVQIPPLFPPYFCFLKARLLGEMVPNEEFGTLSMVFNHTLPKGGGHMYPLR